MSQKTIAKWLGIFGFIWGIAGVTLILLMALSRVLPFGLEVLRSNLNFTEWLVLLIWCLYMLFTEGYKGFQKQFSPRVVARALHLRDNPKTVDIILAPFFCMGYFRTTKKRLLITWSLTGGIVLLIVFVRHISQPWRGIIDLGVALGLVYGLVTIYYFLALMSRHGHNVDPEVN